MALVHESIAQTSLQYQIGDVKPVGYDISFTLHQIVEPTNDLGWLLLNGASLSTTTYATLFAKYGYTFGGSGASFSLPDFTDGIILLPEGVSKFVFGRNFDGSIFSPGNVGEITHLMIAGETPVHSHTDSFSYSTSAHDHTGSASISAADSTHQHLTSTCVAIGVGISGTQLPESIPSAVTSSVNSADGAHSHTASVSINANNSGSLNNSISISASSGGGTAHNNMSPYQVCGGWLVRYK